MGLTISGLFSRLFGKKQMRILMGKTKSKNLTDDIHYQLSETFGVRLFVTDSFIIFKSEIISALILSISN